MSEVVVDTNIWVIADEQPAEVKSQAEKDCILACCDWLELFVRGDDCLVIDDYDTFQILTEYRNNIRSGGLAENILNKLSSSLFSRLVRKRIELDSDNFALVPSQFQQIHKNDRKFVAVAIQCEPFATIFHATDRGWITNRDLLEENSLPIKGLCPDLFALT